MDNEDSISTFPPSNPLQAVSGPQPQAPAPADCWNTVGVNGNKTCPELPGVAHCRNCPVYSAAGARLLDRQRPADYQRYWTDYFARAKKDLVQARRSVVVFQVGPEWLALPTGVFQEVAEPRPIHSLPHRRNGAILGVVNIRGQLLVCVSLGRLLGIERGRPAAASMQNRRLMVIESQGSTVAFPVEDVQGLHRFGAEDLLPAPPTLARSTVSATSSIVLWKGRKVGCLDEETLFAAVNRSLS